MILPLFSLNFNFCAAQQPRQIQADFYQGLLYNADLHAGAENAGEKAAQSRKEVLVFFEKALGSANIYIRQAAAEKMLNMFYEGEDIAKPALDRAWQEASGSWAAAFEILNAVDPAQIREKALSFILGSGNSSGSSTTNEVFPDEAAHYVLHECRNKSTDFFNSVENALLEGHIAASRSRFSEALDFFRSALDEDPEIFLQYPDLLNDLGRCFQYASVGTEGIQRFLDWEKGLPQGQFAETRFRLLFFAARIARQRGLAEQGIELFIRALPYAPDSTQADACIWYILDSAWGRGTAVFMRHLAAFVPQWHDEAYFFDVLDRASREFILRQQWKDLISVFSLLQEGNLSSLCSGRLSSQRHSGAAKAKYAWIIGRSLAEGYLLPEEIRLAAEIAAAPGADKAALSKAYLQAAYNEGTVSSYYRAVSAAALGDPFLDLAETPAKHGIRNAKSGDSAAAGNKVAKGKTNEVKLSPAMEFLLGFFSPAAKDDNSTDTAVFAPRYIRALEKELPAGDLRVLAKALEKAGLYAESMRLVSVYMERENYELDWQDLELSHPRPFQELIEQYAKETGLAPELLFGLIRTESAFQSGIVSRAGAVGLTQLMPPTAEEMAGRIHRLGGPDYAQVNNTTDSAGKGPDLRDPKTNIHIGAVYLAYLKERVGDTLLALLSYNGGMNRVRRWRSANSQVSSLPTDLFLETIEFPETREYGRRVLAAAALYRELYYSSSPRSLLHL